MRSKKALKNIITSLILQIITIICGFIVPKLIISTYGSSVNGLVSSIFRFLSFITLLNAGFGPVVKSVLYKPIADKDNNTIARILKASEKIFRKISLVFIVYIFILCIVLPMVLTNEFDKLYTISLIVIISISTFAEYFFGMTYKLYLEAKQDTYIISIIQISTLVINTIVILILIYFGVNIQIVKLVSSLVYILRPILQNIYVKKKYNINLKNVDSNYIIKQKWNALAQHFAAVVHNNTDVAILTVCGNLAEVSVYSVYMLIVNSVKNVVKSFIGGIDAAFGDMIAKDEDKNLNKNFKIYEGLYFSIITIIFSSTLFLIVPFVSIYTKDISDANYIRPVFAYLMVIAEFIWAIRQPYNDLVKVAGHFKETRIGAWVEAISNIVISLILVWHYGIVGVAIGTLFAMVIRTIEFMYYTTKNILKRRVWYTFKRLIVIIFEIVIIAVIVYIIPFTNSIGYKEWIIQAIIICLISSFVVIFINLLFYKENISNIIKKLKKIVH